MLEFGRSMAQSRRVMLTSELYTYSLWLLFCQRHTARMQIQLKEESRVLYIAEKCECLLKPVRAKCTMEKLVYINFEMNIDAIPK